MLAQPGKLGRLRAGEDRRSADAEGLPRDALRVPLLHNLAGAAVAPEHAVAHGLALLTNQERAVPGGRDADAVEFDPPVPHLARDGSNAFPHRVPELVHVLLDPQRMRAVRLEWGLMAADFPAVGVEGYDFDDRSSCVNADDGLPRVHSHSFTADGTVTANPAHVSSRVARGPAHLPQPNRLARTSRFVACVDQLQSLQVVLARGLSRALPSECP